LQNNRLQQKMKKDARFQLIEHQKLQVGGAQ
jgi:hypothetical protein